MRLTTPTSTAHIGRVEVRGVQRVIELDASDFVPRASASLDRHGRHGSSTGTTTQAVPRPALHAIESRTAIVIPCKDEALDRIEGVWSAVPSSSLIVLVSASQHPEAYARERDALAAFCRATGRSGVAVHQRDAGVAAAFRGVGMTDILDDDEGDGGGGDGLVYRGKGEALVIGLVLAATAAGPPQGDRQGGEGKAVADGVAGEQVIGPPKRRRCEDAWLCDGGSACRNSFDFGSGKKHGAYRHGHGSCSPPSPSNLGPSLGYYKYIGFIDADNFVPGSVHEYCKAFSAGLHLADDGVDAMVRISWASKPKIRDGKLDFKPFGRSSEVVNHWLNRLLNRHTEVINYDDGNDREAEPGETSLICTGNAGEHAMSISLGLKLRLASGYAIEPFHFLDMFERFGSDIEAEAEDEGVNTPPLQDTDSLLSSPAFSPRTPSSPVLQSMCSSAMFSSCPDLASSSITSADFSAPLSYTDPSTPSLSRLSPKPPSSPVQILQIQTRNPHFHDDKGEAHVSRMWKQALGAIYHSPLTSPPERDLLRAAMTTEEADVAIIACAG